MVTANYKRISRPHVYFRNQHSGHPAPTKYQQEQILTFEGKHSECISVFFQACFVLLNFVFKSRKCKITHRLYCAYFQAVQKAGFWSRRALTPEETPGKTQTWSMGWAPSPSAVGKMLPALLVCPPPVKVAWVPPVPEKSDMAGSTSFSQSWGSTYQS